MIRTLFFTLVFSGLAIGLSAQTNVKAVVKDSTGAPLPAATVMLMNTSDSVLVSFSMTNNNGSFELSRVRPGDYFVRVTYIGYGNYEQPIRIDKDTPPIDLGDIQLEAIAELLEGITITGQRNPIEISKDTISFSASSFKGRPNEVVEELLKRLPGVEVEQDGTVKAQGETVQRVLVDGKEFFGNDPKIATKNLPANAIDKVQVYDRKSDQAEFTGIDDGQREKTINLSLKEDRKAGVFGTITAGYGDAGRFQGKANVNTFNKQTRLSFIGNANNTNEQGFSLSDYQAFSGGGFGRGGSRNFSFGRGNSSGAPIDFGNNNGIATTTATGVNLNHEFSKKTELTMSYFYSRFDKDIIQSQFRETFLEDASFFTDSYSRQDDLNNNHNVNLRFEHEIDSLQSLQVRSAFTYNNTGSLSSSNSLSYYDAENPQNANDQLNSSDGNTLRSTANVLYRRKFNKPGRTLSLNLNGGLNNNASQGLNEALNIIYRDGTPILRPLDQRFDLDSEGNNYGIRFAYTEPLARKIFLEATYNHGKNQSDVNQEIFDLTGETPSFSEELSNIYRSDYLYNRAGINFLFNGRDYSLTLGSEFQRTSLDGDLVLSDAEINQAYTNYLPNVRFNYSFTSTKSLRFDYETRVNEPSIQQLQPIIDNSDPLNIYVGNPDLDVAYSHTARIRFLSFNPITFSNMFAFVTMTYTKDAIKNTQIINEDLTTLTTPQNVGDEYRVTANLNFGTQFQNLGFKFNIGPRFTYLRSINFINGIENDIDQSTLGARLRFDNINQKTIALGLGGNIAYATTQYSIANNQNRDFINHTYFGDLTINFSESFRLNTQLDYQVYTGLNDGFNQDIPIWRASVSKNFLAGNKGQLTVGVYDILNENRGISRENSLNFTQDEQVNALGRYFLLSFTYSLRGFDQQSGRAGNIIIRR